MNYYERYCGDYQRKTAHLSLAEHGAYTMLLDAYYATELPLPADYVALYRICRAMDKAEQQAVRAVSDQFFPIFEDGLRHNSRADEVIGKARPKMDAARENGRKGGRPRKNPMGSDSDNPTETQEKPNGFSYGNPTETHRQSSPTPYPSKPKTISSPRGDDDLSPGFARFWQSWPSTERKVAKAKCAERWRKGKFEQFSDEIVAHVTAMQQTKQWRDGFEPAPLTYLNQRRWEDGVSADSRMNGHAGDDIFG